MMRMTRTSFMQFIKNLYMGKEKRKRRGEVKLSCFFDKRVKPMNLARLNKLREKEYNEDERSGKHSIRKERQRTLRNLEVEGKIYIENTPVKEGDQGRPNSNSTPVEK